MFFDSGFNLHWFYDAKFGNNAFNVFGRNFIKSKIDDLYSHLKRCARCPSDVKILLERLERQRVSFDTEGERLFFDQIWSRLGHDDA